MTDTPDPAQAVSQLGESLSQTLAQTAESQRALAKEMTGFAKDESLRFVNLRLERNGAALDKLQHCAGLPGLIGAQQEWLRDLFQDYTSQSMRLLGAWRGVTKNVMETAAENAAENIDRVQQGADDVIHEAENTAHHAETMGYQAVEQVNEHIVQDVNNNYVQH